jgi:hypothetical protein
MSRKMPAPTLNRGKSRRRKLVAVMPGLSSVVADDEIGVSFFPVEYGSWPLAKSAVIVEES